MEHNMLYLLFPIDTENIKTDFEDETLDFYGFTSYVSITINQIIDFFNYEEFLGFYDSVNIRNFIRNFEKDENIYPSPVRLLQSAIKKWGEDWRKAPQQKEDEQYTCYDQPIKDNTICEVTKCKISNSDFSYLIINIHAFKKGLFILKTTLSDSQLEIDSRPATIKDIFEWFSTNRKPQRNFHLNPKHGINGQGAHRNNKGDKVSKLYCSEENAQRLLNYALGGGENNTLYYYDLENKKYVEFKKEIQNIYHGFHLEKEDNDRIPTTTMKKINFLIKDKQ